MTITALKQSICKRGTLRTLLLHYRETESLCYNIIFPNNEILNTSA